MTASESSIPDAIVGSFMEANQYAGLQGLIEEGLAVANDAVSEGTLLRESAVINLELGNVLEGRARYGQALAVFDKYPGHTQSYIRFFTAITHTTWAQEEARTLNCGEAWRQVTLAKRFTSISDPAVVDASTKVEAQCGPEGETEAPG